MFNKFIHKYEYSVSIELLELPYNIFGKLNFSNINCLYADMRILV